ncbi:nickel transporter [Streptomyces sp. NPDC005529]|uniref:nickel transporter n=1 Tax=unclassified Streptomyces TaxID=2593676 RepID=UPI0033A47992
MSHALRRATFTAASIALATAGGLSPATAAPAHPLGNFTVNYHTGLSLHPDRLDATVVVDRAEISTLQERSTVDADHNGAVSPVEARAYARAGCTTLGRELHATVRDASVTWAAVSSGMTYEPGEAGLKTSRLTCAYTTAADLTRPAEPDIRTAYDTQRIGWREMTVQGHGVQATGTHLPSVSPTDELRHYPRDPAASPLDQRSARMHTTPGASTTAGTVSASLPGTDWFNRLLATTSSVFNSLVGSRELTVPIGLLALLPALIPGASHAVLPGHGKTIMASYLACRRGTRRDAITVGATVTLTHTAGVLVLGLALPAATHLAGETVLNWLGAASGLIVTGIGLRLPTSALRNRHHRGHHHHHHGDGHGHHHSHHGHHRHDDHAPHEHTHDHTPHTHDHDGQRPTSLDPQPTSAGVATLQAPENITVTGPEHHHAVRPRRTGRGGLIGCNASSCTAASRPAGEGRGGSVKRPV